jgi:hypothetical protein
LIKSNPLNWQNATRAPPFDTTGQPTKEISARIAASDALATETQTDAMMGAPISVILLRKPDKVAKRTGVLQRGTVLKPQLLATRRRESEDRLDKILAGTAFRLRFHRGEVNFVRSPVCAPGDGHRHTTAAAKGLRHREGGAEAFACASTAHWGGWGAAASVDCGGGASGGSNDPDLATALAASLLENYYQPRKRPRRQHQQQQQEQPFLDDETGMEWDRQQQHHHQHHQQQQQHEGGGLRKPVGNAASRQPAQTLLDTRDAGAVGGDEQQQQEEEGEEEFYDADEADLLLMRGRWAMSTTT